MTVLLDASLSTEVSTIVGGFKNLLLARGQTVSDSDANFAAGIVSAWDSGKALENPTVFAADCGFGKSTLLEVYLRHKSETNPRFGAIVVKQKRTEVEALVDAINRNVDSSGRELPRYRRAFAIRGYDPEKMTYDRYRRQFRHQAHYPIIVMTAEMFARQSSLHLIDRFSSFYDTDKKRRPRRLLLIDERPVITRTYNMSDENINRLIGDVREVSHRGNNGKDAPYYTEFLKYARALRKELEDCGEKRRIESIEFDYELPQKLREDWAGFYEGEHFDALSTFEASIKYGGLVTVRHGRARISTVQRVYYEWTQYNPFILDATASTDPYYDAYDFDIIDPPEPFIYKNVQFHVCNRENLSKSFYDNNPQSIDEVSKMVKEISAKHDKTMVVFYKDYLPELTERLAAEVDRGEVLLKHFDSGRGTNDFRDCDAAVFLGWLLKGEAYYPQVASAINNELLSYDVEVKNTGLHFTDPRVESFKNGELVTERVQDIHRTRPRTSDGPVSVYLFHRDKTITDKIVNSFPGAGTEEYMPLRRLSGTKTHADNFIDFMRDMEPGDRIKSKEIYEGLGIHRNTFGKMQKEPRVIEAMREYGVIRDRTFFVKRAKQIA